MVEWWYPILCDEHYFAQLREDYPENAYMTDEELHDHYNDGNKYRVLWDHLGDAYEQFEALADKYLELEQKLKDHGIS